MTDAIYLTTEEIERLHSVKLEGTLAIIRDRFVIGCVTGLRFSDYSRFGPAHLQNGIIKIMTKKTSAPVIIPAHRIVIEVLRRNRNEIPAAPTLRYFNMKLPEIGNKARIRTQVQVEKIVVNGKEEIQAADFIEGIEPETSRQVASQILPKCELITTHTARRSFATNAYLAGIPSKKIMLITGHSTEESFFKYIRIGAAENANELKNHHFFKG